MLDFLSERIKRIEYPIRKYSPLALELEAKGEKILYLNIGDPLKYDFRPPEYLVEYACKVMRENKNFYSNSQGIKELREAIAYKEKTWNGVEIPPKNIYVTIGVSEAINLVYMTLLNEGDEVLIPDPSYPLYIGYADVYGAKKVFYKMDEENGWNPDTDDIRKKISNKTKLIVVNNPNNPTGSLYSEKALREVLDIAAEHKIPVVSDEIYDAIVYEGTFKSLASIAPDDVMVIGLNGFSKTYLVTGWRLGYIYLKGPEKSVEAIGKSILKGQMARLSATTPLQYALARALREKPRHLADLRRKLDERRRFMVKRLNEIDGIRVVAEPRAAFYVFPRIEVGIDDEEFTKRLLIEEKVFVVYGSGFGPNGKNHIRLVFLPPVEVMEEALDRIERFIKRLKN